MKDITFITFSLTPGNYEFEKHDLSNVIIKQLYFHLILSLWTPYLLPAHGSLKAFPR